MEAFRDSMLQLITQTSTNLPPDVRHAMARITAGETGARSLQALNVIGTNIDMACDNEGPICQDTGWPTFEIKTPVGVNQLVMKKQIREAVAAAIKVLGGLGRRGVLLIQRAWHAVFDRLFRLGHRHALKERPLVWRVPDQHYAAA